MKTQITKQTITHYSLTNGDYSIKLTIADNDRLRITSYKDGELKFENIYCEETLDKWEAVAKLIIKAIKLARRNLIVVDREESSELKILK